jgi:hypothetical protein
MWKQFVVVIQYIIDSCDELWLGMICLDYKFKFIFYWENQQLIGYVFVSECYHYNPKHVNTTPYTTHKVKRFSHKRVP